MTADFQANASLPSYCAWPIGGVRHSPSACEKLGCRQNNEKRRCECSSAKLCTAAGGDWIAGTCGDYYLPMFAGYSSCSCQVSMVYFEPYPIKNQLTLMKISETCCGGKPDICANVASNDFAQKICEKKHFCQRNQYSTPAIKKKVKSFGSNYFVRGKCTDCPAGENVTPIPYTRTPNRQTPKPES